MRHWLIPTLLVLAVFALLWQVGPRVWSPAPDDTAARPDESAPAVADPELRGRTEASSEDTAPAIGAVEVPEPPTPRGGTAHITGRIVGPDGEPVPGATVVALGEVVPYGDTVLYRRVPADEDGRFTLPVHGGIPLTVAATAPGYSVALGARFLLAADDTSDTGTLQLVLGETIVVRVIDEEGLPVEDAFVTPLPEADPVPPQWSQLRIASDMWGAGLGATGADGRVAFEKLPPGRYRLLLEYGYGDSHHQVREHVVAGSGEVVFVVTRLPPPRRVELRVRVVDPEGRAVPQARARLYGPDGSCRGICTASEPATLDLEDDRGPIHLFVWDARDTDGKSLGHRPQLQLDVRSQDETLLVQLEPGLEVTGRIIGDGAPATWQVTAETWLGADGRGVTLTVPASYQWPHVERKVVTDASGAFRVRGFPPGVVQLRVVGPGRLRESPLVVEAGTRNLELSMLAAGQLRVHVRPPEGQSLGGVGIRLQRWQGSGLEHVDVRGTFGGAPVGMWEEVFSDLDPTARYRLLVHAACSGVACGEVELAEVDPRDEPYVVQLVEGRHVRGRVVREDGTPVWGAQVYFVPWPGGEFHPHRQYEWRWLGSARTDRRGVFDLAGLGEEDVVLAVEMVGLTTMHDPPRVTPGTHSVRIVVHPTRTISGRIVDPAGGRLDELLVTAVPDTGEVRLWQEHDVAADGFFVVEGLGPGEHRVVVWNGERGDDRRCALSEPVPAGARDVRLTLGRGDLVSGVVRDAGGQGVPGVSVRLRGPAIHRGTWTDGAGRYAFHGLPAGTYRIEAVTPTGVKEARQFQASSGPSTTKLDLDLPPR